MNYLDIRSDETYEISTWLIRKLHEHNDFIILQNKIHHKGHVHNVE